MKEFSETPTQTLSSQPSFAQQPSRFKSSGFQSFRHHLQLPDTEPNKLTSDHTWSNFRIQNEAARNKRQQEHKQRLLTVPTTTTHSVSKRLSRSMESLDNILKELSDVIAKEPKWHPESPQKPLSSSLWVLNDFDKSSNKEDTDRILIQPEKG